MNCEFVIMIVSCSTASYVSRVYTDNLCVKIDRSVVDVCTSERVSGVYAREWGLGTYGNERMIIRMRV